MKKLLALLAVVLCVVSCQTEPEGLDVNVGGEIDAIVNVTIPEAETRATNSAEGAFKNVDFSKYTIRYILQVYYNNEPSQERLVKYSDNKSVAFDVRLVPGRDYNFVVWADIVEGNNYVDNQWSNDDDLHYNTTNLHNITLKQTWVAMDETRDAFTGYYNTADHNVKYSSSLPINITLKRPFAKLRVVTTDMVALNNLGIAPYKATVLYANAHRESFNAYDGTYGELTKQNVSLTYNIASYDDNSETDKVLFTDYFFAVENDLVKFNLTVMEANGSPIGETVAFNTDIPVNANYLTTIKGNILTDGKNFNVTIDDVFAQPNIDIEWKEASTAQELVNIIDEINNSTTDDEIHISLNGNIDLNDLLGAGILSTRAANSASVTIAEGKEVVLDIKDYTITGTDKGTASFGLFNIQPGAKLTIEGNNGSIKLTAEQNRGWGAYSSVISNQRGEFVLNGGTIEHLGGTDMAYGIDNLTNTGAQNVKTTINGGVVKSTYRAVRQFLNSTLALNELIVNGGTINGANNKSIWMQNANDKVNPGKLVVAEKANLYGDVMVSGAGAAELAIELSLANAALKDGATVIPSSIPVGYALYVKNGNWVIEKGIEENGNEISISNVGGLQWLAEKVNAGDSFAGKTVVLTADIDLNNENWTAIGTLEANFCGTFDGCDYTIKNLKILVSEGKDSKAYLGLFGYAKDATIKNVVFENVDINVACLDIDHSQGHIGAVAGSLEGTSTIEDVTVKGDVKVYATQDANGASRVAVIAGGNSYGNVTMKNVHVIANEGSYLIANNNTGALAGQLQGKSVFENCSSNIDVTVNKFFAGGIIGIAAGDQTFTNCHTTGNIAVVAGREGRAHDQYRVGGIAGGWADGAKNVCTLTNCSYTGKVSGKNSDGSVANPLDYMGYVGRGYTLNGCQGSKVVIDGVEFVQKYNDAAKAGIYDIINLEISNKAELFWLAQVVNSSKCTFAGQTVKLAADIDLNNEEWTPIGSAYEDHGFMGNFDGNGKTIKNLKITNISLDADGYAYAGLFGVTEGVDADNENYIKNLTIENVTINTEGHIVAAAIAYPYYTNIENITVKGDVKIKGGDYTSGVLAYTRRCINAKNVAIRANEGSVIEGASTIGGVISDIQMNGGLTANYSNFEATGLTIKGIMSVGGISGIISRQTLDGATVKNVTIVCDDARKGIVTGSIGDPSVIKNVVYENVTGAEKIVGATWKDGAEVVVNGNEYSAQK